jgi:hypothetical protein
MSAPVLASWQICTPRCFHVIAVFTCWRRSLPLISRKPKFLSSSAPSGTELENSLRSIFLSMSGLLVASGFSYRRVGDLLKFAFVSAAADIDREVGRKPNIARIAATTGLTRINVAKLLRMSNGALRLSQVQNRAMRVAMGWASDKQFVDLNGRPRVLAFSAGRHSFSVLAKRYSGDIPAKATLLEMLRLGLVAKGRADSVRLIRMSAKIPRKTVSAMRAISPWVDSLWSSIRTEDKSELRSKTHRLALRFDSIPQVMAALRDLDSRRIAFVRSVAEIGPDKVKLGKHEIRVTIGVAAAKSPVPILRKGRRSRR